MKSLDERTAAGIRIHVWSGLAAGLVLIVGAVFVKAKDGVGGAALTREPQVTLDGPLWTGAISNLGAGANT